jgi:peptide/nickel transport system permease protein
VLWLVSIAAFLMVRVSGDPVRLLAPLESTNQQLDELRHVLGLDRPLPVQYLTYVSGVVSGDLGQSLAYRRPVLGVIIERIPATIELTSAALVVGLVLGVTGGLVAAVFANSRADHAVRAIALVGQALPHFLIALLLIMVVALNLRWFPASGRGGLNHLVLPAFTLGAFLFAQFMRVTRAEMLEALHADYIRTALAKGLPRRDIVLHHAFRNAVLPLLTLIGLSTGTLLSGAVITETIFAWPGLGQLAYQAVSNRDYPLVQGIVLVSATVLVVVNVIVDLAYVVIDPRTRSER